MKKSIIIIFVLVFALTGCKSENKKAPHKSNIQIWIGDKLETAWSREYPVVKKLEEQCDIIFDFKTFPVADISQKYNLLMASDNLPDLIIANLSDIKKYARQDVYEPIDNWLSQAPNIEKALDSDPIVRKTVVNDDGKIYAFPFITANMVSHVFMIREDWLEKLNIGLPKTLDDWYNTLVAFRDYDPNQNGIKDEIPFSVRMPSKLNTNANLTPFMAAYGIDMQIFVEDGRVKYGAVESRMKEALIYLNKLYSEKLLDNEYITTDTNMWNSKFERELSGASIDWITRMEQFENSIKNTNPAVRFVAVEPPAGPTGIQMQFKQQAKVRIEAGAISSKSKNKEAIIRLYDYIYSDEGTCLMNWGIENTHYKMTDGKPEFTDLIMRAPDRKSPQIAMFSYGIARDWPRIIDKESEDAMSSPAVIEGRKMYEKFLGPAFPVVTFTNEEGIVDSSKGTAIRNYTMDGINKFIMGIEPISKFDDFVEKLYDMGIEEYISIHRSAYNRYINR